MNMQRPKSKRELSKWWRSLSADDKRSLAERCDTSPEYLSHVVYGRRLAGHDLAVRLSRATRGAVRPQDVNPRLYPDDLPELCGFGG